MPIQPTPPSPAPLPNSKKQDSVKVATPDLLISTTSKNLSIDTMADMIFQEIGGHEIISISRNDLVNGRNISYQLVRNLEDINIEYNSNNILPVPGGSEDYFNSFPIRFNEHIPTVIFVNGEYRYLENPLFGPGLNSQTVYIEEETGDLIIDLVNIKDNHQVEVEIVNKATIEDDTIYNIGES
jgi:hypothetical protein